MLTNITPTNWHVSIMSHDIDSHTRHNGTWTISAHSRFIHRLIPFSWLWANISIKIEVNKISEHLTVLEQEHHKLSRR
ncbi:hypothetical protein SN13T_1205 [Lactiplantibacillus plantarum]|jgi:hypothetical protein|nr:hypothetical protein SN13T_1205 [Lactiplantibacillus plantarum]